MDLRWIYKCLRETIIEAFTDDIFQLKLSEVIALKINLSQPSYNPLLAAYDVKGFI